MEIGEYEKGISGYYEAQKLNPVAGEQIVIYMALVQHKRYSEAKELLTQIKANYPNKDSIVVNAIQYAVNGEREKALNILKSQEKDFGHFYKTILFAQLNLKEDLIKELQQYYDPDNSTAWNRYFRLANDPTYDIIRSDPRFQKILAQAK